MKNYHDIIISLNIVKGFQMKTIFKPSFICVSNSLQEDEVTNLASNFHLFSSKKLAQNYLKKIKEEIFAKEDESLVYAYIAEFPLNPDPNDSLEALSESYYVFDNNDKLEELSKESFVKLKNIEIGDWVRFIANEKTHIGVVLDIDTEEEVGDDRVIYILMENDSLNDSEPHAHVNYLNIISKISETDACHFLHYKNYENIKRRVLLHTQKLNTYQKSVKELIMKK